MKKITSKKNLLILLITASSIIGNFLININTAQAYDICAITLRNGSQGQQKAASIYPNGEQPNNPPYWVFKEGASSVQIVAETDYCVGKKITLNLYEEDGWGVKNDNEIDINDEKGNAWDGIITVPSTGAFTINLTANEEFCDNNWGFDCHWYFTLETVDGNDYDSLGKDGGDLYTECDGVCDFAVGDDTNFIYKGITENTRTTPIAPEHWYYKKVNQNAIGNINGGHDNSKAYLNGIFPSLIECKKAATVALGREAIDTDCIKDGDPYPISPQSVYSDKEYNDGTTGVTPPVSGVEVGSVKITPYNGDYNLLAPIGDLTVIKGAKEGEPADPNNSIGGYLNTIFKIAIGLMGALAVIMIVIHGVQYMGDESVFGKTEAKHSIMTTIGGLLLALCAYALLNTINPDLLGGDGVSVQPVTITIENGQDYRLSQTVDTDVTFRRTGYYKQIKDFVTQADYSSKGYSNKINHCMAQVAVQRESNGDPKVIGHDENAPYPGIPSRVKFINSGKKQSNKTFTPTNALITNKSIDYLNDDNDGNIFHPKNPNDEYLGLDWRFSHGIGLMQTTFFPDGDNRGTNYKQAWSSSITNTKFKIKDLFVAKNAIQVGVEHLQYEFKHCGGDVEKAYRAYGGGGCEGTPYSRKEAKARKNLYDQCLAQDK